MLIRRRALVGTAVVVIVGMAFAPLAAADTLVQFQTLSTGTRVLTAAVAPVFPAVTDLSLTQTIATTQVGGSAASTEVTEVAAVGNTWSVKAQMCGPNDYATPTSGDCVNKPARMERANGDTIPGASIEVSHGTPVVVGGGGTTVAGSETHLGAQITLLSNTGQDTLQTYTGTYTGTTNLSIANFTRIGTWKGMWVVTETL